MAKIVLVEDEADIRDIYVALLNESGHEVLTADDGDVALEVLQNNAWDLLLLDIMLPKKDGLAVLRELKKQDFYKNQPIIMLTNLEKDAIVQEALESGALDYLVKSDIEPSDVTDAVEKYLPKE